MSVTVRFTMAPISRVLKKRGLDPGGKVQVFVAWEVARRNDKYIPLRSGTLKNTVAVKRDGTQVIYPAPYAEKQYEETPDTRSYDPHRGGHWHERMMAAERKDIIKGAAKLAGGRSE
jgi:hypothetical protein